MAIYHLSVKKFTRSKGQSATAAAAYRSGTKIIDGRTGQVHDYRNKGGIVSSELVLPRKNVPEWAKERDTLWSKAEAVETRKDSVVAREFEIALPSELSKEQRRELAVTFAKELVRKHGFAAEVSIHKPSKQGDDRNHHAHILVTTRKLEVQGFTKKTRELDDKRQGPQEITQWRERFAQLQNQALERHRYQARVDHRTLRAQGIDRAPTQHKGPHATAIERRNQQPSRIENDQRQYETTPEERQEQRKRQEIAENRAFMLAEGRQLRDEMARERRREQLAEQQRRSQEAERERQRIEEQRAQIRAEAARIRERQDRERDAERARERARNAAPQARAPERPQAHAQESSRAPGGEPEPYKPMSMEEGLAASQARFEERTRQKEEQERREQQEREDKERLRLEKQRQDRERNRNRGGPER